MNKCAVVTDPEEAVAARSAGLLMFLRLDGEIEPLASVWSEDLIRHTVLEGFCRLVILLEDDGE